MKKKKIGLAAGVLCLLLLLGGALWTDRNRPPYTHTVFAMGSQVRQTVYGSHGLEGAQAAASRIYVLENQISWRREHSSVYNLNASDGRPTPLSDDARSLLETALEVSEKSGGAFDVTIAPISRLWDFDSEPHLPDPQAIRSALPLVDYRKVALIPQGADMEPGMAVDLGAAGKGAACDAAVEAYKQEGVKAAVIAVGGSVGLYGKKPDGTPWQVSVRDPWGEGSIGILSLDGGFVSTSGSYEKTFEEDGRTYHHLLDPKTGYPAESGLVSVTVCCANGALSDCLATACFVLGYDESLPLLEAFSAEAVFIDEKREITVTPGLESVFTPRD